MATTAQRLAALEAADVALGKRIDKEVAARVTGDTSLANRVTALEGGTPLPDPVPVPPPPPPSPPPPPAATLTYTTSIAAGSTISGLVPWLATITAGTPTKVEFLIDGTLHWLEQLAPWGGDLDTTKLTNGAHTLTVVGYDAAGAHAPAGGQVTVNNVVAVPPPTPTPTGVSLATHNGNWANAMTAAKTAGNVINVPAGTWPSPVIRPYAGLTIKGVGPASIITRASRGVHAAGGFFHVTVPDVTISDLTIRGWPIASGLSDDILINGIGAARLKVLRVALENAQGCGMQLASMADGLFEDVSIKNTLYRDNGYHGVALWPYHGTVGCTFRRVTIDGANYAGIFLDAGTTVGTAGSVDNNVFEDIVIRRAARQALPAGAGMGAGWMVTGAKNNRVTRFEITDQTMGAALAFGFDQSGLGSTGNVFTGGVIARTPSTVSFGGTTGNTVDWRAA